MSPDALLFILQTNIRAPIPHRFVPPKASEAYSRYIRALYSPHAHPIYLAFKNPFCGVHDILALRDEYLDHKLNHLAQRTNIGEPEYEGDGARSLVGEWVLDPRSMWGKSVDEGTRIGVNDRWN